ncbi:MAG TPA: beta-ketoacyl-[acyl-carrier-protein] synthase family protein [Thermoanaerobaculia bacterium]
MLNPQSSIRTGGPHRVVITGIGIVSPFGRGKEATLEALRNGRSGIVPISGLDSETLNCRIAGQIAAEALEGSTKGHDRFTKLALLAAEDAMAEAGELGVEPERIGVLLGTGLGGCETLDDSYRRMYGERGRIPPMAIPSSMYNAASSAVSTRFGAKGVSYSVVSACASSAHAIGLAMTAIRAGQADAVLTGGSDAPLTLGIIKAWEALRVLAIDNDHPAAACRPFSGDRKGLVLAEGAAVFVLESYANAQKRGATIVAEVLGFGATSDAGHITDPSADGAARAMKLALADGHLNAGDIHYINAHGTGTRANDTTETAAIKAILGDRIPVSSTKSLHGHAMGASGAIEIAASILALRDRFLPPTINLHTPDPACDLDYVPHEARETSARAFLSNSFGFGGMNAVVAVRV